LDKILKIDNYLITPIISLCFFFSFPDFVARKNNRFRKSRFCQSQFERVAPECRRSTAGRVCRPEVVHLRHRARHHKVDRPMIRSNKEVWWLRNSYFDSLNKWMKSYFASISFVSILRLLKRQVYSVKFI
jgi:hypothetical protein